MCGNGIRSLMMFARQLGVATDECTCETKERLLRLWHKAGRVTVDMGDLVTYSWTAEAEVDGKPFQGAWLNTGVPHVRIHLSLWSLHTLNCGPACVVYVVCSARRRCCSGGDWPKASVSPQL